MIGPTPTQPTFKLPLELSVRELYWCKGMVSGSIPDEGIPEALLEDN